MFNVRLIRGEKGMLELKGGGNVQICTEKKIVKARGDLAREKGQRNLEP